MDPATLRRAAPRTDGASNTGSLAVIRHYSVMHQSVAPFSCATERGGSPGCATPSRPRDARGGFVQIELTLAIHPSLDVIAPG